MYRVQTKDRSGVLEPRGNFVRQHEGKTFGNLHQDLQETKACYDAVVYEVCFCKDTSLWPFQMFIWKDMAQQAHDESIRILGVTVDPNRGGLFGAVRGWSGTGSHGRKTFWPFATEIKIASMQADWTQSWMVISRCVEKYVTELAVHQTKSYSVWRSVFQHREFCCDKTNGRIAYSVFIFVIKLTDQTTKLERYPLRSQGQWRLLEQNLDNNDKNLMT